MDVYRRCHPLATHWAFLAVLLLLCHGQTATAKSINATVNTSHINVHTGPGRGYPIFYVLERNQTVQLLKQRTDWIKIKDPKGNTGWISAKSLPFLLNAHGLALGEQTTNKQDFENRRFELGLMTGDFDGAETIAADWSYRFSEQMALGLRYEQATGDVSNSEIITGHLSYLPFPSWRIAPYLMIGAGTLSTDPNATIARSEVRNESAMLAAAGAYVYLTQNFVIKAEYDNFTVLTQRENNEEINAWKIGLSIFF